MKLMISSNYESIVARGLITPSTKISDFIDKIYEEVSELEESIELGTKLQINEELADVILTCLNFAKHYDIDIELELNKKIQKNFCRANN